MPASNPLDETLCAWYPYSLLSPRATIQNEIKRSFFYLKVYVGMTDLGCEMDGGWLDRVRGWDHNVQVELSALVGRVCGAEENGLPVQKVVFLDRLEQLEMRAGGRVLLNGHVLLEHSSMDSR